MQRDQECVINFTRNTVLYCFYRMNSPPILTVLAVNYSIQAIRLFYSIQLVLSKVKSLFKAKLTDNLLNNTLTFSPEMHPQRSRWCILHQVQTYIPGCRQAQLPHASKGNKGDVPIHCGGIPPHNFGPTVQEVVDLKFILYNYNASAHQRWKPEALCFRVVWPAVHTSVRLSITQSLFTR